MAVKSLIVWAPLDILLTGNVFFSFGRQNGDTDGDGSQHRNQLDQHPRLSDTGEIS